MSTAKSAIITIAAAMVVNLTPLGEALEAAASVNPLNLNDDFPPLIDTSLRTDGGGVTCHYSNEKTMEKAPNGFDSNVLKRFYSNFPQFNYREAGQIYKFEDPPEPTGLDPLRN
ncbi:hypothetical protein FOZ62_031165, partial [Perkinsus olseni]